MSQTRTWEREERGESLTRRFEEQTARLPSDVFMWSALGAIVGSLLLHAFGKREQSLFVGQWVPAFLVLGVYQKLVKGSEWNPDEPQESRYH